MPHLIIERTRRYVTDMLGGRSRNLDAEVAGSGVTDLQGKGGFWGCEMKGLCLWPGASDEEGFWVEVVAHIGCTGIQGLAHRHWTALPDARSYL